jgi:hypothetical protein
MRRVRHQFAGGRVLTRINGIKLLPFPSRAGSTVLAEWPWSDETCTTLLNFKSAGHLGLFRCDSK